MRSSAYDFLPHSINFLKKKMGAQDDSSKLIKSTDYGPDFGRVAQDFAHKSADLIKVAKNIYSQFAVLRNDYECGKINLVAYKGYLAPLNNFLTDTNEKIDIPGFDPTEIIKELKRLGF